MRKPRSALVLLLLLVVGVSLSVPAEDVPETPYDESETLPCEGTPLFSIAPPEAVAGTTRALGRVSSLSVNTVARRYDSYWEHQTCVIRAILDSLTILNCSLRC